MVWYRARSMSGGKVAMWLISFSILLATAAVLVVVGLAGIPGEWIGLIIACGFAASAFALGYYE